jgi:hypothetical protein
MFEEAFEKIDRFIWETNEEEALYRLEQSKIYLSHYGNVTKASNYLNTAMKLLGLEHSLVGELNFTINYYFLKIKCF